MKDYDNWLAEDLNEHGCMRDLLVTLLFFSCILAWITFPIWSKWFIG